MLMRGTFLRRHARVYRILWMRWAYHIDKRDSWKAEHACERQAPVEDGYYIIWMGIVKVIDYIILQQDLTLT